MLVHADGCEEVVQWLHESVSARLNGPLTFVGARGDAVLVALREPDAAIHPIHAWNDAPDSPLFEEAKPVRGPIVCIGTSADAGFAVDVDVTSLTRST